MPGTVIESVFENTTDDDIAQSITDSLDRYGRGGMVAPFRIVDGTVSAPALAFASETGTGLYRPSAGVMGLSVLGVVKQTWFSSGSQIAGGLNVIGDLNVTGTGPYVLKTGDTMTGGLSVVMPAIAGLVARSTLATSYSAVLLMNDQALASRAMQMEYTGTAYPGGGDPAGEFGMLKTTGAFPLLFGTGNAEKMRLGADGSLAIGSAVAVGGGPANSLSITNSGFPLRMRAAGDVAGQYWYTGPDGSAEYVVMDETFTGVKLVHGTQNWAAASDERLKTALKPIEGAMSKVAGLRAVTGRLLVDSEDVSRVFLIAQDVQAVLPEAVSEGADGMLSLRYTEVIPLLVAAVKELNLRLAAMEG